MSRIVESSTQSPTAYQSSPPERGCVPGEDSKYGNIPFDIDHNANSLITAVITMKSGETYTAENLPDGLGYDVTETPVDGYANIPDSLDMPINFREGKTGENKSSTDVNPYVSTVAFKNILPICKITDDSGVGSAYPYRLLK